MPKTSKRRRGRRKTEEREQENEVPRVSTRPAARGLRVEGTRVKESTPFSPEVHGNKDSLYGFERLDSPLTFSPIVNTRSRRSRVPKEPSTTPTLRSRRRPATRSRSPVTTSQQSHTDHHHHQPQNGERDSTPITRDSLYGFDGLDSPIAFKPLVDNSPHRPKRSHSPKLPTRSHSPASIVGDDVPATSSSSKKLSDTTYYQPTITTARVRRKPRPKKKADQLQAELDEWAKKMNAEFAEIAKVKLNVW